MTIVGQFYPTTEDVVNVYLRSLAGSCARKGIAYNVLPGSEAWLRARAIAAVVVPAFANNKLGLDAVNPLTAQGDDVINGAAAQGVTQRPASAATGYITAQVVSGTVAIPDGYPGTMSDGTPITVFGAHPAVANGDPVLVTTTTTGEDANQTFGASGTWDSASVGGLKNKFTVASGGLADASDADTVEEVRQAWLDRLANPGKGGNWAHVCELAKGASASIASAWAYPGLTPGSYGVAIMGPTGDGALSAAVVAKAASAIVAELPGHPNLNCTTIAPDPVDVVIKVHAPLPKAAGGPGGGFLDAAPWPNDAMPIVKATSFNSTTGVLTTNAATLSGLVVGNHIGIWDPAYEDSAGNVVGKMYEFVVSEALDPATVTIKVNGGFPKDFSGCYISAGAVNLVRWAESAVAAFATLGPGEKTTNIFRLPRAARKPDESVRGPQRLESRILNDIQSAHDEISDIGWTARYSSTTTTTRTEPTIPDAITDPPFRLTLAHLAFRYGET